MAAATSGKSVIFQFLERVAATKATKEFARAAIAEELNLKDRLPKGTEWLGNQII